MTTQTRLESFIETVMNVTIGGIVGVGTQSLLFPLYGIHVPTTTNISLCFWFTLISIVRSYIVRRWFNGRLKRAASTVASVVK